MTAPRLSSETIHASSVACARRAVLIRGPSGAGKSDLALRLIDRGFTLISDDQTVVRLEGDRLIASAPPSIAGKLEVRGIGIVQLETVTDVPVALAVDLTGDIPRMPDENREHTVFGLKLPLVSIDAATPSAVAKVVLALDQFGLQ